MGSESSHLIDPRAGVDPKPFSQEGPHRMLHEADEGLELNDLFIQG